MNIHNSEPREIRCIRNDNNVWGGGGENAHLLEIGKVYNLTDVEVHGWHTLVWLAEFPSNVSFNSVLFEELDGDEEEDDE